METTSKFRNLYIFKTVFGYAIFLFCIAICLKLYLDIYSPKRGRIALFFLIGIILMTLIATIDLLRENKIIIKKDKMIIFSYFSMKKVTIQFSDIDSIERKRIVHQSKGIQISDGYYESKIILNNGKCYVISPDRFANYKEMISIISSKLED